MSAFACECLFLKTLSDFEDSLYIQFSNFFCDLRKLEECDIWGGWDGNHPTVTRPMQLDMLQVLGRLVELLGDRGVVG